MFDILYYYLIYPKHYYIGIDFFSIIFAVQFHIAHLYETQVSVLTYLT